MVRSAVLWPRLKTPGRTSHPKGGHSTTVNGRAGASQENKASVQTRTQDSSPPAIQGPPTFRPATSTCYLFALTRSFLRYFIIFFNFWIKLCDTWYWALSQAERWPVSLAASLFISVLSSVFTVSPKSERFTPILNVARSSLPTTDTSHCLTRNQVMLDPSFVTPTGRTQLVLPVDGNNTFLVHSAFFLAPSSWLNYHSKMK